MLRPTQLATRLWLPLVGLAIFLTACSDSPDAQNGPSDAGVNDASSGGDSGVTAPGPDADWGTGSDTGSLEGDVWTPGRDANGLVNAESWAKVPGGRWIEVNGTRLDGLDAEVKAKIPGWKDYGSGGWGAVTHAWNAPAADPEGSRAWWVASGGHGDSSNNGIYRFDAFRMAYAIEHLPSDTTAWSDGYKLLQTTNTFTTCPESIAEYDASVEAGTAEPAGNWFYDELFWDRQPTSRHTYSGVVYVPKTNELVMGVRRLWRYARETGQWVYKRLPGDDASNNLGEEVIAVHDQYRDQIIVAACGSGGPWSDSFDMSASKWTGEGSAWNGWDWNGAADTRDGDIVTIFRTPEDPASGEYALVGRYLTFDVKEHKVVTSGLVQFADGLSASDFAGGDDGAGMVYVPPLGRYWVAVRLKTGALGWFELDPTTSPWTLRPLVQDGPIPALSDGKTLVRRRMLWMPKLHAVLFLGSADTNIRVHRF
ncbi:hypothetical protein [Polyangium aurulentum]|uniref:hypothetical protein n=1 Tax=Polyangium aurulentum TaxID=2567896 RepID=UPI0010AEC20D|nr:hypothetical protein [Polyangium aurulentum]UQA60553.1 hypothetical protein E8A73_008805 [Polyangium aurulentum]